MRRGLLFLSTIFFLLSLQAQDYELKSTTAIFHDIQELHSGIRVLYIAAHPDDENTRLISWLENEKHIRTAYLSLTRGQGGQNLIGDEKGDALGVIRTYELLEARKLDGGEQYFTRAVDFGYSKSADESFEKWKKEEVLKDVVYAIRMYRPHIIITRFPPNRQAGHGHHEASAILAQEAFDLAGDQGAFPEQLNQLEIWTPQALYHNTSNWWDKSLDSLSAEALKSQQLLKIDIGGFHQIRGLGINEIASLARSKHRCQAFGTPRDRGAKYEYLQLIKGEWTEKFGSNIEGVWAYSPEHQQAFEDLIERFSFTDRILDLEHVKNTIDMKLAQRNIWADPKDMAYVKQRVDEIKRQLIGLRIEAYTDKEPAVVGSKYKLTVELYNAGNQSINVGFEMSPNNRIDLQLRAGQKEEFTEEVDAPSELSNPYWLRLPHQYLYELENEEHQGMAEVYEYQLPFQFASKLTGVINSRTAIHRKWNDRSYGEFTQPFCAVPKAHITPSVNSMIVISQQSKELEVKVFANEDLEGYHWVVDPVEGWQVELPEGLVMLKKGQSASYKFKFTATKSAKQSETLITLQKGTEALSTKALMLSYDHIPNQIIQEPNTIQLIPIKSTLVTGKVLYIDGSGDEVDDALSLIGYTVEKRALSELTSTELAQYKAVVVGIRAYNTNADIGLYQPMLMQYVNQGGNLIVQYSTQYDLKTENIGPYPFKISRNRVTEENCDVEVMDKNNAVFKSPNKMVKSDWQDWVQERGLYFASDFEANYTPLISWNDKNEEPQTGGLIYAKYGEGSYFYTGISFFRQLPAGVTGAYKLLVNMIEFKPN